MKGNEKETVRIKEVPKFNIQPDARANVHKEEFMARVKAMSMDELEMIVNYVPVELCLNRIESEINRAKQFEDSIKAAMTSVM